MDKTPKARDQPIGSVVHGLFYKQISISMKLLLVSILLT